MTEYAPQIVSKLTVIAPICLNKLFVFSDQCSQALMTHNDIKFCSELPVWVCNFIFSCYFALIVCNYFCFVSLWRLALVTFTFKRSVCFVFIFPCVSLIQMYQLCVQWKKLFVVRGSPHIYLRIILNTHKLIIRTN